MSWDDVKRRVEEAGGVLTTTMDVLRDADGAGKLGVHVRASISRQLAGMGIGHVPGALPANQQDQVRLYKRGTPVGELIECALNPGEENDRKLVDQRATNGPDYRGIVQRIRELVEE